MRQKQVIIELGPTATTTRAEEDKAEKAWIKRPHNDDHSRLDVVYKHVGRPLGDTTISIRADFF